MSREREEGFPELPGSHKSPRDSIVSVNHSRPPSYATVSTGSLAAQESARRAIALQSTDCKSLVSAGDIQDVDETHLKRLEGEEQLLQSSFGSSRNDDDDDETESVYYDVPSGTIEDLIRSIEEIQRQQEALKSMHADHDKKLEELISQQPAVNKQLQLIRRNSKQQLFSTEATKTKKGKLNSSGEGNHGTNDSGSDSGVCEGGSTRGLVRSISDNDKRQDGNNKNPSIERCPTKSRSSEAGASAPHEPVIHRKPSKRDDRSEKLVNAIEQQHLYVQLEKLYSNFHRLHLPTKTVQSLIEGNIVCTAVDPAAKGLLLAAGNRPTALHDQHGHLEMSRLAEENTELMKKNQELQAQMEEIRSEMERRKHPPVPPKPRFNSASSMSSSAVQRLQCVTGRPSASTRKVQPLDVDIRDISVQYKIEKYSQKLQEERMNEGSKQVSSSFYTAYRGCRVQLEVFLNGNGTGRNKSMALFVRVVPGEFDHLVKWPITLQIRATLMNQKGLSSSVEDSGNQFQFDRPRGGCETEGDCWGLVEFVDHKMISQPGFIKDDAIVLRCKIGFTSDKTRYRSRVE